jgi:hypothetical protein
VENVYRGKLKLSFVSYSVKFSFLVPFILSVYLYLFSLCINGVEDFFNKRLLRVFSVSFQAFLGVFVFIPKDFQTAVGPHLSVAT